MLPDGTNPQQRIEAQASERQRNAQAMHSRPLHIFISHPSHLLTDSAPHGDGLLAWAYIKRLAGRGHQVHVAVPLMQLEQEVPPNIHLYPLKSWTKTSAVKPSALNRVEYAVRVRGLLQRIRKHTPIDLIHQLNPVVAGVGLFLAGCGLPIVLGPLPPETPRVWDQESVRSTKGTGQAGRRVRDFVLRWQVRQCSALLIPTPKSLEQLPDSPRYRRKVKVLHYGVDSEGFAPGSEPAKLDAPSILFVSNMLRRKGIFVLLEAFERIAARFSTCTLCFVGCGPDADSLRQRIEASPFRQQITLSGEVAPSAVPKLLRDCTVFCFPSYCEPFGMVALEAMSSGKPVIGTGTGGLGLLLESAGAPRVKPGDVTGLADALAAVLGSPVLQQRLGAQNRERVLADYAWSVVIEHLEAIYRDLLTRRPASVNSLLSRTAAV